MITDYTINQYISQLKKADPELIVIFGSAAADPSRANDLDFFVVKKTKKNRIDRCLDIKFRWLENISPSLSVPTDLIVYTPEEFIRAKKEKRMLLEEILTKGKIVYEKN
ncbi:MAG: nucleotidyltransferase domain-containing protein [Patescibacteria group bacterium]